jgi:peroxiredoxin
MINDPTIFVAKSVLFLFSLFFTWPPEALKQAPITESERTAEQAETTPEASVVEGKPAPDFVARAMNGETVQLSKLRGKVVLLDFMASWCGICLATAPEIKQIYSQFDRAKLEIISVSLDGGETTDSTLRDLNDFLARSPVNWPVIFDDTGWDNAIARSYSVNRLPLHVIIDQEGIVRLIAEGGETEALQKIKSTLRRLT